jgi:cyclase
VDRRAFLTRALPAVVAAHALPAAVLPAIATERHGDATFKITPLAEGFTLISGAGGNVILFQSPEGVLLVDGGSPEHSTRLLKTIKKLTRTPQIHTLFNTHWHWNQTGSNAPLGASGTRIIAHENTRLWLTTDVESKWEKRTYERLPPKALPTSTLYTSATLTFGDEHIEYGHAPQAHTDGDLYIFFRKANVLVAGDLVTSGAYPISDYCTGGWIGGLVNATQTLLNLANDQTKIVPGTGPVLTRADVQAEHDMLVTMKRRLSEALAQGMSVQDMLNAALTRDFDTKWGDPSLFVANAWPGLVHRARELGVHIV